MAVKVRWFPTIPESDRKIPARYREGTSDEQALTEVVQKKVYRRKIAGFDVEPGETWLDLGANIGSFAIYCLVRGATAECYEPDPECFKLLEKNAVGCKCFNTAVTNLQQDTLTFYKSRKPDNHYRGTFLVVQGMQPAGEVPNLYIGDSLSSREFDGIKLDIEGSEFGMIDDDLIPKCKKLVMEYHSSRDRSYKNLERRLKLLGERFDHIWYPKEYTDYIKAKSPVKTWYDKFIYCWND